MSSFLLILLPIIIVNSWHAYLLIRRKGIDKPDTLSEHAAEEHSLLIKHRVLHTSASILLILYAFTFLLQRDLTLVAVLLIIGAVLDIIEVMTLDKDNASGPEALKSPHTFTAWGMALCYMLFAVFLVRAGTLSPWSAHAVWISFVGLLLITIAMKFRYFWAFQMGYFSALSLVILLAHASL